MDPVKLELLLRKGVYPYSYITSFEVFDETELPPIEAFYNDLSKEACTEEDYAHAQKVWKELDLKSLNEMVHLYISSDVVLLGSVLQQYRTECLSSYNLDPVHYYTAPSLTWDTGLKFTKVELELFSDPDMYTFIEQAIRGGISTITHRYAKANNHHLPDYNPELPESYLGYIDANNLYGWAMCQKLPTSKFKWQDKLLTVSDIMAWNPDSDKGYFIECDVRTNPEDHDRFNDLPPFPESLVIEDGMVSDATRKAMNRRGVNFAAP